MPNNMEAQASGTIETINLIFRAMRALILSFNVLVILFTLYFAIFGRNLGGDYLMMSTWVRIVLALLALVIASFGIVVALWHGKKTKFHLKMIAVYLASVYTLGLVGIILAAIYVRKPKTPEVIFIVLSCLITFFISMSTIGFGYALKKTKLLRRFNVFSSG